MPAASRPSLEKNPRVFALDVLTNNCREWDAANLERSASCDELRAKLRNAVIIGGSSNPDLAFEVGYETALGTSPAAMGRYADGEVTVTLDQDVTGKDVYVIQSAAAPVNDSLMEALLVITAARRNAARSVTLVAPSLAYSRSDGASNSALQRLDRVAPQKAGADVREEEEEEVAVAPIKIGGLAQLGARGKGGAAAAAAAVTAAGAGAGAGGGEHPSAAETAARLRADTIAAGAAAAASAIIAAAQQRSAHAFQRPDAIPINFAHVADLLVAAGVDRVISVNLCPPGTGQIEGFFPPQVPVENLSSTRIIADQVVRLKLQRPTVVAPNEDCIQLAANMRNGLQTRLGVEVGLAVMLGACASLPPRAREKHTSRAAQLTPLLPSPPLPSALPRPLTPAFPEVSDKEHKMTHELLGDVADRDCIITDHLIDSARTLCERVKLLKSSGAKRVVASATHGIFSGKALQRISRSALTDVVVTDSIPLRDDVDTRDTHKIMQISVAPILAAAIIRCQTNASLLPLRVSDKSTETEKGRYAGQGA
jgi:ribose-phosphate pyrophosphokinase